MSGRRGLKKQNAQIKLGKKDSDTRRGGDCEQFPTFSFVHLTKIKNYNFERFGPDVEGQRIKSELYNRIEEITKKSWAYWLTQNRQTIGCEKLSFWAVHFSPSGIDLTKDEDIFIFRFNRAEGRIIGFRKDKCPIYYIIGYDFDHSAYDHGS